MNAMLKLKIALLSSGIIFAIVLSICAVVLTVRAIDSFAQIAISIRTLDKNQEKAQFDDLKKAIADLENDLEDVNAEIRDLSDSMDDNVKGLDSLLDDFGRFSEMLGGINARLDGGRGMMNPEERELEEIRGHAFEMIFGTTMYVFDAFLKSADSKKKQNGMYWDDAEPVLEKYREMAEDKGVRFSYRYFASPEKDKFTLIIIPEIVKEEEFPEDLEMPCVAFLLTSTGMRFLCKESPVKDASEFTIAEWGEEFVLPHEGKWDHQ